MNLAGSIGVRVAFNGGTPTGRNYVQIYDIRYDVGELAEQLVLCSIVATPTP